MKLVNLVNSYLASNFHPDKANQLANVQSRLICFLLFIFPRVLYFGCPNTSGTKTFERKAEFGISSTSHWLLSTSVKQTDRSLRLTQSTRRILSTVACYMIKYLQAVKAI